MLRKCNTPHGTSFFEEVDLEYNTDDGDAIPELPRLDEKGGKVKISSKLSEKQREEMKLRVEEFDDVMRDKPGRTDMTEHHIETGTICLEGGNEERSAEDGRDGGSATFQK